ncbi:MAG: transposase [Candidatus Korobacteraceae bacterium]
MAKPSRPALSEKLKAGVRTFFVTTRTAEGKSILQTDRMADLFADVLRSYIRAGKFRVHDFVVMRNHVHVLITLDEAMTVEKAMQLIKGGFSYRARTELEFKGEVWQRGFSDVRVRDEESFWRHQKYIYDNPVRAGMARVAEEFPHCSLYLRKQKSQGLKPSFEMAQFGTTKVVP